MSGDAVGDRRFALGDRSQCGRCLPTSQDLLEHTERYCALILSKIREALEAGVPEEERIDEPWLDGLCVESSARYYAEMCLSYLNEQGSHGGYKLVQLGNYSAMGIAAGCILFHCNFKARSDNLPVETFFAQFRTSPRRPLKVDFCLSMGSSETLPHWEKADLRGCQFCSYGVHHPSQNMLKDGDKLVKG